MFLDTHSLSRIPSPMYDFSDADYEGLSGEAAHCCPNCDGVISLAEDQSFGVCRPCNFGLDN